MILLLLESEGEKEKERDIDVRNIEQLPPVRTPTQDQT